MLSRWFCACLWSDNLVVVCLLSMCLASLECLKILASLVAGALERSAVPSNDSPAALYCCYRSTPGDSCAACCTIIIILFLLTCTVHALVELKACLCQLSVAQAVRALLRHILQHYQLLGEPACCRSSCGCRGVLPKSRLWLSWAGYCEVPSC